PVRPMEIGLGVGSLAACFPPCNRLAREGFRPADLGLHTRISTGTALGPRSFLLAGQGRRPTGPISASRRTIMAYERYGTRDRPRDERSRWRDEGLEGRERSGREDRGFFERAGDEVASWFGDEDA